MNNIDEKNLIKEIQMLNLPRLQKEIELLLNEAIKEVINSASYINNYEVSPFEQKLINYCAKPYAVGVGSCTDALYIGLKSIGVESGDEVITVSNSFFATTESIMRCGALPVIVDIDENTLLMDINQLPQYITEKTTAILPVHLYGNVVDIDAIKNMLHKMERDDIKILEDCAHAFGSRLRGKMTPIGDCGAFSFNPGKNCGAFSDAGALVISNKEIATVAKLMRDHGRKSKNEHVQIGLNSRLSAINDKVLNIKIEFIEQWNDRRREIAETYKKEFMKIPQIQLLQNNKDVTNSYHQFVIKVNDRNSLQNYLKECKIHTAIHYPELITHQVAFKNYMNDAVTCIPVTEKVSNQILSIPCHAQLTNEEVNYIINAIKNYYI